MKTYVCINTIMSNHSKPKVMFKEGHIYKSNGFRINTEFGYMNSWWLRDNNDSRKGRFISLKEIE